MAETSSIDTPSIDEYVSSLIASGAVEEGAFYKWTTPSGEEYYGPNPRRARTVTPRTQRTPTDPLPDIEEPDIPKVQQIIQQSVADPDFGFASDPGRTGSEPENEPLGFFTGPDGSFQMREGVTPAEIALALQNDGINQSLLEKFNIDIADVIGIKPNSFTDAIKSFISFLAKGVTGNLIDWVAGKGHKNLFFSIGELSNIPEGNEMLSQALANIHTSVGFEAMIGPGSILEGILDAMNDAQATLDKTGITVAEREGALNLLAGLEEARKNIHAEMSGEGPDADVTADDLGFNSPDADLAMSDPNAEFALDKDGNIVGIMSSFVLGGGVYSKFFPGHETTVSRNSTKGKEALERGRQRPTEIMRTPLARRDDKDKKQTPRPAISKTPTQTGYWDYKGSMIDDPSTDLEYAGAGSPLGQFPVTTRTSRPRYSPETGSLPSDRYPSTRAPTPEETDRAREAADKAVDTKTTDELTAAAEAEMSDAEAADYAGWDYDEGGASYFHEGGLINKNSELMGGGDSTDHDYQPLTDARPMFDEGGMVKKPSYQAGGKVKPQQSPYAAFQNRANQQTRQMMQPKQQPGQRPQPMAGQPRTPAAKGAPQAGSDVDITAKKGEFIIPVDVVKIKGTEFFEKAISGARKTHFEATGRRNAQKQKRVSKNVSRFDPNAPKSRRNPFGLPKIAGATPSPGTPPVKPKVKRPVPGARPTSPVTQQPTNRGSQQLRQPILS